MYPLVVCASLFLLVSLPRSAHLEETKPGMVSWSWGSWGNKCRSGWVRCQLSWSNGTTHNYSERFNVVNCSEYSHNYSEFLLSKVCKLVYSWQTVLRRLQVSKDRQVLGDGGFWWDHCVVGFTVKWGLVMSSVSSNVLTLSTLLLFLEKAALVSPPTIPKRFGVCYNWTGSGTSMVF